MALHPNHTVFLGQYFACSGGVMDAAAVIGDALGKIIANTRESARHILSTKTVDLQGISTVWQGAT